jgi:3'-5' exoribonuclease
MSKVKEAAQLILGHATTVGAENIASEIIAMPDFLNCSGSSKPYQHHYGRHGLIIHTSEVIDLCMFNNLKMKSNIDLKELFLAALCHDIGKIWDYTPVDADMNEWESTAHKRHIHHISRSAIMWHDLAHKYGIPEDAVLHAILAHHGQREWGSPVGPNSKLAWMLHLCDGISARMYDAETWDQVRTK